ncbi:MAG: valine--tRNA ligase [Desulfobacteraceae bacterium]|nr:valine--tRNA ligase [Desulfobacteraceae bacterium]
MSSDKLEKGYEPHAVEKRWYDYWQKEGLFKAEDKSSNPAYSIVIPPPNVTGVLHIGHALVNTLQDILCRYHRLKGENVLWMPGTDHAGIATQNVVERKLAEEGTDRHQLGREKFIEAVWEWREKYGSAIINQLKRLGASCDWDRERFTMDEGLSLAVRKVFVQLYEEGLIYKGDYIINWCCRCHTALSDLEVEHEDLDGHLYHIRYPFADGDGHMVVATTRPETMLGDTAVAINPEDERYRDLTKASVILPLMDREIPIIKDTYVDTEFGTGALKVTPAHDPNDFDIGNRHNLDRVKVIGEDGRMTDEAGKFKDLERFECRKALVKALKSKGLLEKIEPLRHGVGHCYRCKTVVEPNLSKQWFVKVKPLAEKAIESVKTGKIRIVPDMWTKTFYDWMYNIKDWCISRQIWWGHQIPAWTCTACNQVVVAMETPAACTACQSTDLVQETDVLDTWFSSALWPFSTMGWPEKTPLLGTFYPTSVLVTGFDILFFWVARMMMMGLHFMKEVPFTDVFLHALLRDEEGQKMSKSKGNVVDPLDIIEKYGTDALRFTLAAFTAQGRDIKMSEKRVEGYRNFINKLWNAARFSLMHLDRGYDHLDNATISLPNKWILSRLTQVCQKVAEALDNYKFNDAANAAYQFVWHEFCDWYVEAAKPALYDKLGNDQKEETKKVLWFVLRDILVFLHPIAPFVTEEIWQKLPGSQGSVSKAIYPDPDSYCSSPVLDEVAEKRMSMISQIISSIRNIRGEMNISPSIELEVIIQSDNGESKSVLRQQEKLICTLARLKTLRTEAPGKKPRTAATAVVEDATVFVSLEGIIDFARESERLNKEINKVGKEMAGLTRKLNNEDFLKKAPGDVVEKVKQKHETMMEKEHKLQATLDRISRIQA